MLHLCSLAAVVATLLPLAPDHPAKDPREAKPGKPYQWQAADGLKYEYHVPKDYDPELGANLTVVLHGNGLDHRWTFANHPVGEFRAADILVSPDGTTPHSGTGANEFLGNRKDADQVHALLEELKQVWNVRQTFLYGHSQGSFFVFYYAGLYPDDLDGVCGHASGMWNSTTTGKKGHHQAIGILHGTEDHVPYGQGFYARKRYRENKYPLVHLRTLVDWNHRPHWYQAQLVLSWCEGMTSEDPERVAACVEVLGDPKVPMGADWGALWAVANRLSEMKEASTKQRALGVRAADAVDELAADHVAAIDKALGKKGRLHELGTSSHVGHLIRLHEDFDGVPAFVTWQKKNKKSFASLADTADEAGGDYWKYKEKDPAEAFTAGLDFLEGGFLHYNAPKIARQLEALLDDADDLDLAKADLKRAKTVLAAFKEGREDGFDDYEKLNAKAKPLK